MHEHGESPRIHSAAAGRQALTCTCSESANSFAEICPACVIAYEEWLDETAAAAQQETIHMSAAQFLAACELFDSAVQPEYVLTVRVERAA